MITEGELGAIKYSIKGLLKEAQSDSIDMGYIMEKLNSIKYTISHIAEGQRMLENDDWNEN